MMSWKVLLGLSHAEAYTPKKVAMVRAGGNLSIQPLVALLTIGPIRGKHIAHAIMV